MEKAYLTRAEAADYCASKGTPVAKNTLQKFATAGGGPIYRRFGNKALYTRDDLDAWLSKKISAPMQSTSVTA
jgi:hypothetical protein